MRYLVFCFAFIFFQLSVPVSAEDSPLAEDVATPKSITLAIHRWASVEKGGVRDSELLAHLVTKDAYAIFFREKGGIRKHGTVSLMERYYKIEPTPATEGYLETVTGMRVEKTDHAANVWANYEIRNTNDGPVTATGVTNLQLYYDSTRWWVLGWVNIKTSEKDAP